MEFRDLLSKYNEYIELNRNSFTQRKLPSSHIEDENQSVKWNREFVEQHNKGIDNQIKQRRAKINKAFNGYIDSVLDLISSEVNCSRDMAVEIYDYVYEIRDWDYEEDKLDAIEDVVELIKRVKEEIGRTIF